MDINCYCCETNYHLWWLAQERAYRRQENFILALACSPSSTSMLHFPRNKHVTVTIQVNYPNTAAGVTPAWMHQVCRKAIEDHNMRLEVGSLSRFAGFDVPRPNILNYSRLLTEGQVILFGATKNEALVASRLNAHRTDSFGVNVSTAVSLALINNNPNTKILDVDKEAVMAAAPPMSDALTNVVGCFGKGCQLGTCAVGSAAVYRMIPLRDVNGQVWSYLCPLVAFATSQLPTSGRTVRTPSP